MPPRRTPLPLPQKSYFDGDYTLTGQQLRVIIDRLDWTPERFGEVMGLPPEWVRSAMDRNGLVMAPDEAQIRSVLGRLGMLVLPPMPGDLGVRFLPD